MELIESTIPGCYELKPLIRSDERGTFVKTFHAPSYLSLGLSTDFVEEYYSISNKNVIRGMHFQLPPYDHIKLVYCTSGIVMDAVIDLRKGSPTFKQYTLFELSAKKANMIYIPKGLAHGFCVLSEQATMIYKVSTIYSPNSDSGIRWDSVDINWPTSAPIISQRDQNFRSLKEFDSPFIFEGHDEF